jgi:ABC-2 type transport system ATP-binding protein
MSGGADNADSRLALCARGLSKRFKNPAGQWVQALEDVSLEVRPRSLVALVGPDGAGKTTFLRLAAGLLKADTGALTVLGIDVGTNPQAAQDRISYMPQRFGLYEDLTVQENLDLYADLYSVPEYEHAARCQDLLALTGLAPFNWRRTALLSGGMKQKLGLACVLLRTPRLLLLDEPTAAVDSLSRRELWEIVQQLVRETGVAVLVSTSYLDEAERCDHVMVLREGRVLDQGYPARIRRHAHELTFLASPREGELARTLQARLLGEEGVLDAVPEAGRVRVLHQDKRTVGMEPVAARLEDGFMLLLHRAQNRASHHLRLPEPPAAARPAAEVVIAVRDLVRRFGSFVAVNQLSFEVGRGQIFGMLGPNGAGKTTTFRMLCGLLPPTSGTLRVAGVDLRNASASARQKIGYVAQRFSLYGQLTVLENLEFFGGIYGLQSTRLRARIDWAMSQFDLEPVRALPSDQLAGGYRQRLAMATALLHEPEILFLDEPTSGADPLARREFWRRITGLSQQGITVVVTTHFLEEAEYCDRVMIQDAGVMLAIGTPAQVRSHAVAAAGMAPTMEDAFISIVTKARKARRVSALRQVQRE